MTPQVTLELGHQDVRVSQDGRLLGEVRLDAPDFEAAIAGVRAATGAAAPVAAEVVLPRSLVFFMTADHSVPDAEIAARVEAATACPIDELVVARTDTTAAAVERSSLEEACEFARAHGFEVVDYTARGGDARGRVTFELAPATPPTFRSRRPTETPAAAKPQPAAPAPTAAAAPISAAAPRKAAAPKAGAAARRPASVPPIVRPQPAPVRRGFRPGLLLAGAAVGAAVLAFLLLPGDAPETVAAIGLADRDATATPDGVETDPIGTDAVAPETAQAPPARPPGLADAAVVRDAAPAAPVAPPALPPRLSQTSPAPPADLPAAATPQVAALDAVVPPPPAGSVFDMNERGLVRPTEDGALTPEGVRVFAGAPPVVPPERAFGDAGAEPAPRDDAALTRPGDGDIPLPDPRTLPPPDATADAATEPATGEADTDASRLPQPRPEDAPSPATETDTATAVAEPPAAADATTRPRQRPDAVEDAVVASLNPQATDFDALAARARAQTAAATAAIAASPAPPRRVDRPPQPTAEAAPQGQRNTAVQPSLPTRASVAEQATERNVIALNRLNLIGVYGAASDRRALLRLPSGRYIKVQVGDRLDGGRVADIGDGQLDYVKGGRRITLNMPRT